MSQLFAPEGCVHLGVDIGGTKMLVVAYTPRERLVWKFPTGVDADARVILGRLSSVVETLDAPVAGIAVPGIVDSTGSILDCDVLPKLRGWNPSNDIAGVRAVLNDGEAALHSVAEGEGAEATVAAIGSGTGIAAAFQVAGKRLRHYRPYAGELGYAPFGLAGIFDEFASGASLVAKLGTTPETIAALLDAGDARCADAVRSAGHAFGASLVTVLHLLHPEKIGLYGGVLRYTGYLNAAFETLQRMAHPLLRESSRIVVMPEPEYVVANGAILAAVQS